MMETTSEQQDEINSLPLMSSYLPMLALIVIYLLAIFKILPDHMRRRKPYNLTTIIQLYNIFQIVTCAVIVYKYHQLGFSFTNTWRCLDKPHHEVDILHWNGMFLRIAEFFETVFFVLRKKSNQVSLLHVYHHISTVVMVWLFVKYNGGMMGAFIGALNCSVHVIMYAYYFLSSIEACKTVVAKFKHVITFVQISQLILILGQCIAAVEVNCKTNHSIFYAQGINISLLIVLFVQFYVKSFVKSKTQ